MRIVVVDTGDRPSGHWNDAPPIARLRQAATFYGVNSRPLGQSTKETSGLIAGLQDLALTSKSVTR